MKLLLPMLVLLTGPLAAQVSSPDADNPMARLKEQADRVLAEADVPFSGTQESAIILMMEERRQASENLFGNLMDFRAGPTQGQEAERLRSAIDWLQSEFLARLGAYLNEDQLEVWDRFVAEGGLEGTRREETRRPASEQTQYVRINNNAFTAEDANYRFDQNRRGGARPETEVIQRGGVAGFHGNAQFLLKDDALNARNPFAGNKPPYQERQLNLNVNGPLIPGRLTTGFNFRQNEAENVDTIRATLPDGVFDRGIVRPTLGRSFGVDNTYRLADLHSLSLNFSYSTDSRENQGIGGFTLPERASTSSGSNWEVDARQFSTPSPRTIYETRFRVVGSRGETTPVNEGIQINVLDAFQRGGAQNRAENTARDYEVSNMYSKLGELWTLKTGMEAAYRQNHSFSENNFEGTFTFSSLQSYLAGTPINFRMNQGEPSLDVSQWEFAFFAQNDFEVTPQLTLMFGARYEAQTNIADYNNFDPRMSVAYALGPATVIRAGAGVFHQRMEMNVIETQRRLDGSRQFQLIIDNPSYPDPFQAGTVRETLPTVRVTDPDLTTPYNAVALVSMERTFFTNLLFTAAYDVNREFHRLRLRNLNAPLPACVAGLPSSPTSSQVQACRPDPAQGNVLNLESTAGEVAHNLRFNYRQRFSIFNLTGGYTFFLRAADVGPGTPRLPTDNYNLMADWSGGSVPRHAFQGNVNARLPLGVFLTGAFSANTGRLHPVTTGRDDNRDGEVNDRPEGVPRFSQSGPKFFNVNFNISKAFFFGPGNGNSRTNVNLFANMTNAFNSPHLGAPSGVLTSPNFGRSTSAQNPRQIEAGMRFQF